MGFSFGSYVPGASFVHKLDPRAKLLLGCVFIVALLCAGNAASLAVAAVFVLLAYLVAHIPVRRAMQSLAPLMLIVLLVAVLNLFTVQGGTVFFEAGFLRISQAGAGAAAFMAVRLTIMMLGMSLITLTTPTIDLSEAFESLFRPLERFGFPAHELGMIMGIALRFMPQFATELSAVHNAQLSRGARLGSSPVKGVHMVSSLAVPLFASVFRHAETLSAAMDARCYHGGNGRTHLKPLKFTHRDALAACFVAALAAAMAVLSAFL